MSTPRDRALEVYGKNFLPQVEAAQAYRRSNRNLDFLQQLPTTRKNRKLWTTEVPLVYKKLKDNVYGGYNGKRIVLNNKLNGTKLQDTLNHEWVHPTQKPPTAPIPNAITDAWNYISSPREIEAYAAQFKRSFPNQSPQHLQKTLYNAVQGPKHTNSLIKTIQDGLSSPNPNVRRQAQELFYKMRTTMPGVVKTTQPSILKASSEKQSSIGVDFDGTLAQYDGWKGEDVLGEPIPKMVTRVKNLIADGKDVVIFTARGNSKVSRDAIKKWCKKHLGKELEVTNIKKPEMEVFYDDRAKEVVENKGTFVTRTKKLAAQCLMSRQKVKEYEPTEAQAQAGNYPKLHMNMHGFKISIENPKDSYRRGVSPDGKKWETLMTSDYGYLCGTEAIDGDHVDVFLGPKAKTAEYVHIVDQVEPGTNVFDEHKCMIGWDSIAEAKKAYLSNYEEGWKGCGAITTVPMEEFKKWVRSPDSKKPYCRNIIKLAYLHDTILDKGLTYGYF
jgi:hypothetical protein